MSNNPALDSQIQSYLRFAVGQQRAIEQIGSFLASFNRFDPNPYLNYAIPDDGATPSLSNVQALITAYRQRDRQPRLEYVTRLAPAVEEVLLSAGFTPEGRLPLLVCTPGSEQILPLPPGIELVMPTSDEQILATVAVQHEAYGESPPDRAAAQRLRESIESGTIAILAQVAATGEPVGAGICSVPENQTTEIAGIGVRLPFRRRGIAGALTTRLAQAAFEAGVTTAFLMAAQEAEQRIYVRAGFSSIGEILHISLPLTHPGEN